MFNKGLLHECIYEGHVPVFPQFNLRMCMLPPVSPQLKTNDISLRSDLFVIMQEKLFTFLWSENHIFQLQLNNKVYDPACCQITIYSVVTELIVVLIDLVAKLQIQVMFTKLPSVK